MFLDVLIFCCIIITLQVSVLLWSTRKCKEQ
jgi:hypothetical protein